MRAESRLRELARDRRYRRRLRGKPPYVKLYCAVCHRTFRPRLWLHLGRGCLWCGLKAFGRIVGIGWNGKTEVIDPDDWTSPAGAPICPVRRPFSEGES